MEKNGSWMRQFLGSHDGWKVLSKEVREATFKARGGKKEEDGDAGGEDGLELGGEYAREMGFDGVKVEQEGGGSGKVRAENARLEHINVQCRYFRT